MASNWKGTVYPVTIVPGGGGAQDVNIVNQPIAIDDNGGSLTIDGTVAVSNFPATQNVAVTGQPISTTQATGTLTNVVIADSANLDAFSRLRVSNPKLLFQIQFQYDLNDFIVEQFQTGSGAVTTLDTNKNVALISVGAGTGRSVMQSYEYIPYQPGKSQFIAATFTMGEVTTDITKRIGYYDDNNGVFLEGTDISTFKIVLRSSTSGAPVDTEILQSNWNIDTLDSGGPSGLIVDVTKAQILLIDLQFLGMGRVRIGFDIDGIIYYAHEFKNANNLTVPYMQTATLPVRAELISDAGGAGDTMEWKCAAVYSEGGNDFLPSYIGSTPEATITATGTTSALWSMRPSLLYQGKTNRVNIVESEIALLNDGANEAFWQLVIGATFGVAPTFTVVSNRSGTEFGPNGTYTNLTNGYVLKSGYISASNQLKETIETLAVFTNPITLDAAGNHRSLGTLTLLVTAPNGNTTLRSACNFIENR